MSPEPQVGPVLVDADAGDLVHRVQWALERRRSSGAVGRAESVEDFRWTGHDHEELVVFWEAQNLPVEGVGSGQGMGVGPGAEGRVADVAFCPPRAKFGV